MNIQYLVSDPHTHAASSSSRSTSQESTGSSNTAISTEAPPSSKSFPEKPSIKHLSDTLPNPPTQIPQLRETSPMEISLAAGEFVFRPQGEYSGGKWKPYEDRALAKQVIASDCARGESGLVRRSWSQVSLSLERAEPLPVRRSATACKSRFWWLAKVGKNVQERNMKTLPESVVATAGEVWAEHNQQSEKTQVREAAEVHTQFEEDIPSENKEGGALPVIPQRALLRDEAGIARNFGATRGIHFYDGSQASENSPEQRRRRKEGYRRRSSFPLKQKTLESVHTADGGEPPPRRHSESMIQEANLSGGQMRDGHVDGEWIPPSKCLTQSASAADIMNRLLAELQAERMQRAQEHRELMGMLSGIVRKGR